MTSSSNNYRSGFEHFIANQLTRMGIKFSYESFRVKYIKPIQPTTYTPDFILPNGILIETKGLFTGRDRKKHVWIREQHPELDIRFVFQRAANRLSNNSKTTYGDWATKNGFKWADKTIPVKWINEKKDSNNLCKRPSGM